jgi:O-antigen ligase
MAVIGEIPRWQIKRPSPMRSDRHYVSKSELLGGLFGMMDMGVSFTYLYGIDVTTYYAITLVAKLALAGVLGQRTPQIQIRNVAVLCILIDGLIISSFVRPVETAVVARLIGFIGQLFLSGTYIRSKEFIPYIRAITLVTLFIVLLYIFKWSIGNLESFYGRFLFFGGSHPNLGGEIIASGVFVTGFLVKPRWFLSLSGLSLVPLFLMQSRAAILFVMFLQAVCIFYTYVRGRSPLFQVFFAFIVLCGVVIAYLNFGGLADQFLLYDEHRGIGSGYVGRDDLWTFALDAFYKSPIVGNGFGYFESIESIGAHNLFLFILGEYGIVGFVIIGWLLHGVFRFGLSRRPVMFWFMSFFILAWFNDRFVNLNPYPLLFYVLIWIDAETIRVRCVENATFASAIAKANVSCPSVGGTPLKV